MSTMMLLKKSLINFKMLIVVVLSFSFLLSALIINGYGFDLSRGGFFATGTDILGTYTVPFAYSSFVVFAGVFPGIPYAYSYLEERNSGYLKFIQVRTPRKKYMWQKIFHTGLSGGMSLLIPGILIFIVIDLLSVDTTIDHHTAVFEQTIWAPYMYIWGGRFVLFLKAILLFLFGVMWSELALLVSLIFKNKYVSFVLPLLIYELIWITVGGSYFNPVYLVRSDFDVGTPIFIPFLVDIVYIAILIVINMVLFKRQDKR